jgi:hypothetical protein
MYYHITSRLRDRQQIVQIIPLLAVLRFSTNRRLVPLVFLVAHGFNPEK